MNEFLTSRKAHASSDMLQKQGLVSKSTRKFGQAIEAAHENGDQYIVFFCMIAAITPWVVSNLAPRQTFIDAYLVSHLQFSDHRCEVFAQ